jgi:hypothetical protein
MYQYLDQRAEKVQLRMSGFIAIRLCIAVVWVVAKPSDLAAARHTRIDAIFYAVLTTNFMRKRLLSQSYPSAAAQSQSRLVSSQGRPAAPAPVSVLREFRYEQSLIKTTEIPLPFQSAVNSFIRLSDVIHFRLASTVFRPFRSFKTYLTTSNVPGRTRRVVARF